jgi:hypothetical protein
MVFGERIRLIVAAAAVMIFAGVWLAGRTAGVLPARKM